MQVLQTVNDAYSSGTYGEEEDELGAEAAGYTDIIDYTDSTELVPTETAYNEIPQ